MSDELKVMSYEHRKRRSYPTHSLTRKTTPSEGHLRNNSNDAKADIYAIECRIYNFDYAL